MTSTQRIAAVALASLALAIGACRGQTTDTVPPETGDEAVAYVDDATIWASDVRREAVIQGLIGDGEPLDVSSELFRQVLGSVVDQKLLAAEARRRGLGDDPTSRRRIAMAEDRILGDILVETSVQRAVTDDAIRGLYQEYLRGTEAVDEFRARQIVTETEAAAQEVLALVEAGSTFESLILTRSIDQTRFSEGDIGGYFTADIMPEGYGEALADAEIGEIVGPFQTDAGWVLLKLEDRRQEELLSLEAARPQIVRFLTLNEVADVLETLRDQAEVNVLIPGFDDDGSGAPAEAPIAPGALAPSQADEASETEAPAP
jgi:peptidyl-prolyl cis-trans isomerase C